MKTLSKEETLTYWLLTTEYPPHHTGGIGTYCYHTAQMLKQCGHSVTVFMHDFSISKDSVTSENGIRLVRFVPTKTKTNQFLGYATSLSYEYAHIVRLYMENEGLPDIIEAQEYLGIAYYLQQLKLLGYQFFSEATILITCHAPSFLCLEYNHVPVYQFPDYWIGQMERSSIASADILISPSKYFVQQAKKRMPWNIDECYVKNPVQTNATTSPGDYEDNYIVSFGKLSPLKGSFQLLQYFQLLWDEGFSHPLHIVGSTRQIFHPERLTMADVIKRRYQRYIERGLLILHGELPQNEVQAVLSKAHVVIVPSLLDNLPYTVLEAMSWGKVVLASRQGGQSEIINDNENGFLFDHLQQDDFKHKLLQILRLDQEQIQAIGKRAIETVTSQCSYAEVYDQKMRIIRESLQISRQRDTFPFVHAFERNGITPDDSDANEVLSVVIPYYEMAAYVEESVKSILASDYAEKEVFIVNDGSMDAADLKTLKNIESKYPVKVFHKRHEGLASARNFGACQCNGKYLAFLDADDAVQKSYYSKAISVLKRYNNVHFIGCWTQYYGDSHNVWPGFTPEPPYLLLHNMINSSALVFKRSSFLKFGGNDSDFVYGMEDWDNVINMVSNNCGGVALPEILFNYRVRKNSMARKFTRVKRLYLHLLLSKKYSELYKMYAVDITNILLANGSSLNFDNPTFDLPGEFYIPFLPGKWQEKLKSKIKRNRFWRTIAYSIYKKIKK
ncbi:MAG TPA: glycosyltransferase [Chitinophagaceae bacterium]|nr:glycosyltransferase [Chitinophagaceae bacterium]